MSLITSTQIVDTVFPQETEMDVALLEKDILLAERKYIKAIIGEDYYDTLVAFNGTYAGVHATLFNNYLKYVLSYYVVFEALPFIRNNITSQGVMINDTELTKSSSHADYAAMRRSVYDKAQFWQEEMINFVKDNDSDYPDFNCGHDPKGTRGVIFY